MPRATAPKPSDPTPAEESHDILVVNCTTGEAAYRPYTAEERAAYEAMPNPEPPLSEADALRAQLAALSARLEAAGL